eukprot:m.106651 g.106651  ORF g.106651 m.106651 type:complete len:88 (-) comp12677_c0_seq3:26-289(-)
MNMNKSQQTILSCTIEHMKCITVSALFVTMIEIKNNIISNKKMTRKFNCIPLLFSRLPISVTNFSISNRVATPCSKRKNEREKKECD